jgi:hypothetical protein
MHTAARFARGMQNRLVDIVILTAPVGGGLFCLFSLQTAGDVIE